MTGNWERWGEPAPGAQAQVARLLRLVPLLHGHDRVRVSEAAALLGVAPRQVVKDLKVLLMCGLPGGYPDDLIDVDLDALEGAHADGVIRVSNAEYLAQPLKLSAVEAGALSLALLSLGSVADPATAEVVERVLAKLQGAAAGTPAPVAITHEPDRAHRLVRDVSRALRTDHQVRLTYWVTSRDEVTERVVDPHHLEQVDGEQYLRGWCHRAGAERSFRMDRVLDLEVTDHARQVPPDDPRVVAAPREATPVMLRLARPAHWMVDHYRVRSVTELPDDVLEVELEVWDVAWLERLLLRLAPHVLRVDPPALAARMSERVAAVLALYPAH